MLAGIRFGKCAECCLDTVRRERSGRTWLTPLGLFRGSTQMAMPESELNDTGVTYAELLREFLASDLPQYVFVQLSRPFPCSPSRLPFITSLLPRFCVRPCNCV